MEQPQQPAVVGEAVAPSETPDPVQRTVRGLRNWLIGLSVVVALSVVAQIAVAMLMIVPLLMPGDFGGSAESIERALTESYGDRIDSLELNSVRISDGPGFVSFLDGGYPDHHAVTFTVDGTEFAAVVMDASELSYTGLTPLTGSIANRLSEEQFDALLKAWKAESDKPVGGITRYVDESGMMGPGSTPETVTVAGVDYASATLWRVAEGVVVEGNSMSWDDMYNTWSLVFSYDRDTGEFTFLGREQGSGWW